MRGTPRERPPKARRWELRAYVGRDPETGKSRQVSRVFRGGKREAMKALDKLVHEVDKGQHVGTSATFGKVLDEWRERSIPKRRARLASETYLHTNDERSAAAGELVASVVGRAFQQ